SLIADNILLSKTDDAWTVRRRELSKIASKIRRRIEILQNPKNCKEAKKILCNLNKGILIFR
uniref:Alpha-(1,6)-fucosyltransferase N- and catalytic domain-containing protein n=1 Tax=Romanomermis culicivorax TaxID=13658 RepID=A0A915IHY1_ROMCU